MPFIQVKISGERDIALAAQEARYVKAQMTVPPQLRATA
jgi:hypothetical protein